MNLTDLKKLAEAATKRDMPLLGTYANNHYVTIEAQTILAMIEVMELQHEAVRQYATMMPLWEAGKTALAAYRKLKEGK
jgi:hypothetical protein